MPILLCTSKRSAARMKETKGTIARLKNSPAPGGGRSGVRAITFGDLEDPLDGDVRADQQVAAPTHASTTKSANTVENTSRPVSGCSSARPGQPAQRRRRAPARAPTGSRWSSCTARIGRNGPRRARAPRRGQKQRRQRREGVAEDGPQTCSVWLWLSLIIGLGAWAQSR